MNFARKTTCQWIGAVSAALSLVCVTAHADTVFRMVAKEGGSAPGGGTFTQFDTPSISGQLDLSKTVPPRGAVVFSGEANNRGVWYESNDTFALIAEEGQAGPGLPTPLNRTAYFETFPQAFVSQYGWAIIHVITDAEPGLPPTTHPPSEALYTGYWGGLNLVAYVWAETPPFQCNETENYYMFDATMRHVAQIDRIAYWNRIVGGDFSILVRWPNKQGLPGPGGPLVKDGPNEMWLTAYCPYGAGAWTEPEAIRHANLTTQSCGFEELSILQPQILREFEKGDTAPDTGGALFDQINYAPTINGSNVLAFYARALLNGFFGVYGIWRTDPSTGDLEAFALFGDSAPGISGDFVDFGDPVLNANHRIAFLARVFGGGVNSDNDYALFVGTAPGTHSLIAREGSSAPGGGDFERDGDDIPFLDPHINGNNRIAFQGWVDGSTKGIWATDGSGALSLVVKAGQTIDIEGVGEKTISDLTFGYQERSSGGNSKAATSGNEDGRASFFNDGDEIVFKAIIDDDEWILVADLTPPEKSRLPESCLGDLNGDGVVDARDLAILLNAFGQIDERADLNADGVVNTQDLHLLLEHMD